MDAATLALLAGSGSYHDDERLLARAEDELVGRCMRARNLPYTAMAEPAISATDSDFIPDLTFRRAHGYGLAARLAPKPDDTDRDTLPADRRAIYDATLFGTPARRGWVTVGTARVSFPTDGCLAEARRTLYTSPAEASSLSVAEQAARAMIQQQIGDDPTYRTVAAGWTGCMRDRGYAYASPAAARQDLTGRYGSQSRSPQIQRDETAIAIADAECMDRIGLSDLIGRLTAKYVQHLPTSLRQVLPGLAKLRQAALARAAASQAH
jgi:hypothetical protein